MTTISGLTRGTFTYPDFNLEYQIERHVAMSLRQWPFLDARQERKETRRRLLDGQAWLWPEPQQLALFA